MKLPNILMFLLLIAALASCNSPEPQGDKNTKGSVLDADKKADEKPSDENAFINSTSKYNYEEDNDKDKKPKSTAGTAKTGKVGILKIDGELQTCLDGENNYSTMAQIQCISEAYSKWDDALNDYYQRTMQVFGPKQKKALRTAQRSWIQFRDAEVAFISEMYGNIDGTMYRIFANDDNMMLVKNRTLELAELSMVGDNYEAKVYDYMVGDFKNRYGDDATYNDCLDKDESNLGMRTCAAEWAKRSDELLNQNYNQLRKRLNDDEKAKLKAAQLKWLKFRDNELKIYDAALEEMGGSMYPTQRVIKNAQMIMHRAKDLENYMKVFEE